MHSYSRQQLIDTTEACFSEITALCADLSGDEWTAQSLCPDWTVRQAMGHAVGVEDVISGWEISTDNMPPFEKMMALTHASADMSSAEFGARVGEIFNARRADLAGLSDNDIDRLSWTPVGVQSYGGFLAIRIFDMWVHVRDCTIPLARATDDSGPAAEIAFDQVERSVGYIMGKKVGLPDGMSLRADITGPVERQLAVMVDGRARAVDSATLAAPDVVLTADSTTFMMLACGRIDPQSKIDDGSISWSGDAHWGEHASRNLAFTM